MNVIDMDAERKERKRVTEMHLLFWAEDMDEIMYVQKVEQKRRPDIAVKAVCCDPEACDQGEFVMLLFHNDGTTSAIPMAL